MKHVFTLVHGTKPLGSLQPPPPWIKPDSPFSKKLEDHFRDHGGAKTFPFEWTGWNQVGARTTASARLSQELKKRFKEFPAAQHYLVCHSHGGNVAMHALLDDELKSGLTGVACLATPFLSARDRETGWKTRDLLIGAMVVPLLALVGFLEFNFSVLVVFAATILFAGAVFLATKYWTAKIAMLKSALQSSPPPADRLLIIRSPADEASLLLAFSQFMSWLVVKVFATQRRWYDWIERAVRQASKRKLPTAGATLLGIAGTVWSLYLVTGKSPGNLPLWPLVALGVSLFTFVGGAYLLRPVGGLSYVTGPFFVAAMILVWPVIVLLSLILVIPFGPAVAFGNILLEVSAESTPPNGPWMVHLVEPAKQIPLRHSVYDNPKVQDAVCKWVEGIR